MSRVLGIEFGLRAHFHAERSRRSPPGSPFRPWFRMIATQVSLSATPPLLGLSLFVTSGKEFLQSI